MVHDRPLLPFVEPADSGGPAPHCQTCGRFIRRASVFGGGGPDLNGEYADVVGTCSVCGSCHVSWEPA